MLVETFGKRRARRPKPKRSPVDPDATHPTPPNDLFIALEDLDGDGGSDAADGSYHGGGGSDHVGDGGGDSASDESSHHIGSPSADPGPDNTSSVSGLEGSPPSSRESSKSSSDSTNGTSRSSDSSSDDGGDDDDADVALNKKADAVCKVGKYGYLRFHDKSATGGRKYIVATCKRNAHDTDGKGCHLSRTCLGSESKVSYLRGSGRPCGLLVNWLLLRRCDNVEFAYEHCHAVDPTDFVARVNARDKLYRLPGGKAFAECAERPTREGETSESYDLK